jgi:hypothetical protein
VSFDDQLRAALDRALTGVRGHLEADLRAFAQELARAAAEERTRAMAQAAEAAAVDVRRQAQAQLAQLRETAQKHSDELRRSAEAQIADARRAADQARQSADDARRAADQQVAAARGEVEALRRDLDRVRRDFDDVRRTSAAEAEELLVTQLAAASASAEQRLTDTVERMRAAGSDALDALALRVANGIGAIDEALSLSGVLAALREWAARDVNRAELVVADASRPADVPFEAASGMVVKAFPIRVGGSIVATLYAEGPAFARATAGEATPLKTPPQWFLVLDVLARHAGRVLEAMTLQQALGLPLAHPVARTSQEVQ